MITEDDTWAAAECSLPDPLPTTDWKRLGFGGFRFLVPPGFKPAPKQPLYYEGGLQLTDGATALEFGFGMWGPGSFAKAATACHTIVRGHRVVVVRTTHKGTESLTAVFPGPDPDHKDTFELLIALEGTHPVDSRLFFTVLSSLTGRGP